MSATCKGECYYLLYDTGVLYFHSAHILSSLANSAIKWLTIIFYSQPLGNRKPH